MFQAMGGIYKIELLIYILANNIGITMLQIKGPGIRGHRVGAAANVNALAASGFQFDWTPVLL